MFRIEMLPAHHGDCLWVTYGPADEPRRILIDGGTAATFPTLQRRIEQLPKGKRHFELLIVSHIDDDHIGGVLKLLQSDLGVTWGEVWFNGWKHLIPTAPAPKGRKFLGPQQGEDLSELLASQGLPWNTRFGGDTLVVSETGPLPSVELEGGMRLTLLSPTRETLERLDRKWTNDLLVKGVIPGEAEAEARRKRFLGGGLDLKTLDLERFEPDTAVANGSSIAVLAEYDGRSCLLTGDAFAPVLAASLQRLPAFDATTRKLKVDAFKLPHHASSGNVSPALLRLLSCKRYLVSTNGDKFGHPDPEALGRVVTLGGTSPELFFNYRVKSTSPWSDASLRMQYGYQAHYPSDADTGMVVDL